LFRENRAHAKKFCPFHDGAYLDSTGTVQYSNPIIYPEWADRCQCANKSPTGTAVPGSQREGKAGYETLPRQYERQLEDALLALWAELPVEQVNLLRQEMPRLMDFCVHLHHSIEHEQAITRVNMWAESEDR
jgi:hypothetical protein